MTLLVTRPAPGGRHIAAPVIREPGTGRRIRRQRRINIWVPLTPILLLLSPLFVLTLPVVNGVVIARRMDPRAVGAVIRTVLALGGTEIDIDSPRARLRLRIF